MNADFFEIDPNNLDKELLNQPKMFLEYAEKLADAKRILEEAKAELDLVRAEEDNKVRTDPKKYGLNRVSEGGILNKVVLTKRYRKALRVSIKRKHAVDILQAAVNAMDHRKKSLERLVHLHAQNYYSTPVLGADVKAAVEAVQNRRNARRRDADGDS